MMIMRACCICLLPSGEGMDLLQQLEQLSISQKQQQQEQKQQQQQQQQPQQQLLVEEVQDSLLQQQQQQSKLDTAATTSTARRAQVGFGKQQQEHSSVPAVVKQEPGSAWDSIPANNHLQRQQQQQKLEQQQAVRMLRWRSGNGLDDTSCGSAVASKQPAIDGGDSRANTIGTVDHLEARLRGVLALPTHDPVQFLPTTERVRVRDELPKLRALLKSLIAEVMQLLVQIGEETGQKSSNSSSSNGWMQNGQIGGLLGPSQISQQQQQQQPGVDLGMLLQQQALRSSTAAAAAAGNISGEIANSRAYARLQFVLMQATSEFRKFAAGNRLSLYQLHTLNLETGTLGVPPPPGHWRKVAQLVKDRYGTW